MSLKKTFQTTFATYRAIEIIGQGGAGFVYKCQDEIGGAFAVKLLNPQNITSEKVKRFKNEITFCRQNRHPNILTVIDDGPYLEDGKVIPFYVMPLYDSSLRKLMENGILPSNVLSLFSQLLDGVDAAHLMKVVHRDLKPENFLYKSSENRLVVADFGIARFQEEELYTIVETKDGTRLANFQYAAPEQRRRGTLVNERSDIYALGLILNEMFTGELALGTKYKTIASVAKEFSYLDDLVSNMISSSPDDRPALLESIKRELIARGNEFIQVQRLNQLKNTVISTAEIDDPLIINPLRIIDYEWENNVLTLKLNQRVNPKWIWALGNMGNFGWRQGIRPGDFNFHGDQVNISARENDVQECVNYLKSWIPTATEVYRRRLIDEKEVEESRQRQVLQAKIEEEEARARLKKNIQL